MKKGRGKEEEREARDKEGKVKEWEDNESG